MRACAYCRGLSLSRHLSRGLKIDDDDAPGDSEHPVDVVGSGDRFTESKDTLRRGTNPGAPDPKPALPVLSASDPGSSSDPVPVRVDTDRRGGVRAGWGGAGIVAITDMHYSATVQFVFANGATLKYVDQ